MSELIKIENLTYRYDDKDKNAVNNLNFSINEGEFVVIIGHNGSGKLSLIHI